jgi:hypothetical protein
MKNPVPITGFAILTIVVLLVFGAAAYFAWSLQPLVGIINTLVLLGLLFTLFKEAQGLKEANAEALFSQKNILSFAAVIIGAVLTHYLNIDLKLGAVEGAGIVGLGAALIFPEFAVPAYTGSFVGMAASTLLPAYGDVLFAAATAGVVYILSLAVFGGFGGKLGTIAASGCIFTGICLNGAFSSPPVPGWEVGTWLIVYSIIAAVVTYYLSVHRKHGAVIASSVVGIVAGLILPALHGDVGKTLAVMAICASFAGMSSTKRFPNIVPMFFAGFVAALVYMFSSPVVGGAGGKLGTIAFGSVMAIRAFMDLIGKYQGGGKT